MVITRQNPANRVAPEESITVELTTGRGPPLRDEDVVEVRRAPVPVVYLVAPLRKQTEAAVGSTSGVLDGPDDAPAAAVTRRVIPYKANYTVYEALRSSRDSIRHDADLRAGYVIRGGERLPVDLQQLLYGEGQAGNLALRPYDTIVIPVRQLSVTVAGAVIAPGVFSYVPDRDAEYYIRLAGGRDRERNDGSSVTVTDAQGRRKERSATVAPADQVFVPADSFAYHFQRIIMPVATLGTLVVALIGLVLENS